MLQRLSASAVRRAAAGELVHPVAARAAMCTPLLQARRMTSSSPIPPTPASATPLQAAASAAPSSTSSSSAAQATPELDAEAAEQVRLAQELGEQAFGENTSILKQIAMRGLRAFVVCGVGMGAFVWARRRKQRELEVTEAPAGAAGAAQAEADEEDPTQRYLEEMRGLGFDVDTLEEELEQERLAKAAATAKPTMACPLYFLMLKRTSPPVALGDVHARLSAGSTAPAVYDPPLDADEGAAVVVVAAAAGESGRSQAASAEDGAGAEAAAAASPHTSAFAVTVPPPAAAAASPSAPAPGGAGVSSSCDVHPAAVPARRFRNIYDGVFYRPPGTTKRALGRMRLIWCCVVTSESWHASLVGVPILIFATLFAAGVVPTGEWFSYVFTAVFTALSLTCLTLSVTLDPGIVPPAPVSEQPTGPATVMVDGQPVECRVCTTCHIIRPPRSTHCRSCDVCVEEFDHHCGILGSCVGKRNFRFFGGFFIVTSLLATYVFIRSMVVVTTTDFKSTGSGASEAWLAANCVLCIFAAIIGGVLVVPCAARYVMLSATNVTFKETLRAQQQAVMSGEQLAGCAPVPEMQSENYLRNVVRRLFSPIGRSRIPFDYYV